MTKDPDKGIVRKALKFAAKAHEGQKRKYTGKDYITHPIEVLIILLAVTEDPEVHAAALLHDVVEDTAMEHTDVLVEFDQEIGFLVWELTDQSKPEDGNRAARKKIDRDHLAKASEKAQTIKLADLISNTKSIKEHDPRFWKVYREEAIALVEVLTKGNSTLREQLKEQLL